MVTERTWEEETLALIDEARKEERRAEQRVNSAQNALAAARQLRESLERSLIFYRKAYGVPQGADSFDPELASAFTGKTIREMLHEWASRHGGMIVMRDVSSFLTALGLFKNTQQASGALYSTAQRSQDFERIERGVFQMVVLDEFHSTPNGHRSELEDEDGIDAWLADRVEYEDEIENYEPTPEEELEHQAYLAQEEAEAEESEYSIPF